MWGSRLGHVLVNGELLGDASCVPQTTVHTDVRTLGLVYENEFECARYVS